MYKHLGSFFEEIKATADTPAAGIPVLSLGKTSLKADGLRSSSETQVRGFAKSFMILILSF